MGPGGVAAALGGVCSAGERGWGMGDDINSSATSSKLSVLVCTASSMRAPQPPSGHTLRAGAPPALRSLQGAHYKRLSGLVHSTGLGEGSDRPAPLFKQRIQWAAAQLQPNAEPPCPLWATHNVSFVLTMVMLEEVMLFF